MTAPTAQRCYRHPYVETYVRCTRCGRPICPDCMISANVGHQCPECVNEGRKLQPTVVIRERRPNGTYAIIAICVLMFLATQGGTDLFVLYRFGASYGPAVAAGEWWRLITPIFLHAGIFHIGFNMFALYLYGRLAEAAYGTARFVGLFVIAGFVGNVLSLSIHPFSIGVGASGGVFGLLGSQLVYFFLRRSNPVGQRMLRGIAGIVLLNLVFGVAISGIDNWAHIGGLAAGAVIGFAADDAVAGRSRRAAWWWSIGGMALVVAIGVVLVVVRVLPVPACKLVEVAGRLGCVPG